MWPSYRSWYLKEGEAARPNLATCRRMLDEHMPELVPTYERLVELADGDELAARFISLYRPPGFVVGCSQGAWNRDEGPVLVRNYDYPVSKAEGMVLSTAWTGRRVIGMSDCLWGLLDGVNDAGLAASLTFGGRQAVGDGFGIPIVIRYLLETCANVDEARKVLGRVPVHAAQNVTLLDREGAFLTVCLSPDRDPEFRDFPAATNHQRKDDWPDYARAVRTFERERWVFELLRAPDMTRERLREGVPRAAAAQHGVRPRLRHALHRGLLPGRGQGRVPLARPVLEPVVRRLRRGRAHAHVPRGRAGGIARACPG